MSDLEKALALIEKEKLEKTPELYLGDCGFKQFKYFIKRKLKIIEKSLIY